MAQYVSGRQPFLNVGIPGITTNTPVLDITGRVGIGTTNPSADLDLSTLRIRQSLFDVNNFSGELGYFLTKDATGLKWVEVPPINTNAILIAEDGNIIGVSSFIGINIQSNSPNNVSVSTNTGNTQIANINIDFDWIRTSDNSGIFTSKNIGIGTTNPTSKLWVDGDGRFSGVVTAVKFTGQTGFVTSFDTTDLKVTGVSTFVGLATFTSVGIGTTAVIGSDKLTIIGDTRIGGDNVIFRVGNGITMSNGIITATTFSGKFLDFVDLSISGIATINTGIVTSLRVSGIATINTGIVTSLSVSGVTTINSGIVTSLSVSGVTTINSGIVTSLSVSGVATINSGIVTSLKVSGVSTFVGLSTFTSIGIGTTAVIGSDKLTIIGDTRIGGQNDIFRVGNGITMSNGIITATTFSGKFLDFDSIIVSGIATIATGIVTSLSVSGVTTINSGIVTSLSVSGVTTINSGIVTSLSVSGVTTINSGIVTSLSVSGVATINSGIVTSLKVSGISTFVGLATFTSIGIGTTAIIGSDVLTIIGDVRVGNTTNTFRVGNGITMSNGIITATTFSGKFLDFENIIVAGIATINTGIVTSLSVSGVTTINSGIVTSLSVSGVATINSGIVTSLKVSGISTFVGLATFTSIGIGTTNPTVELWVDGDAYFIGSVTSDKGFYVDGELIGNNTISGETLVGTALSISGISTFGNSTTGIKIDGNAGIITSNTGIAVTFFGNLTGTASTASFATTAFSLQGFDSNTTVVGFATTATNLANGATGSLPYQNSPGITTFLSAPTVPNQVLIYDTGSSKPKWGSVIENGGAISGITVRDEGIDPLTTITTLDIFGNNITVTSGGAGIASIRVSDNLVGTGLSISGISTFGNSTTGIKIDGVAGIITSNTGTAVTFVGNLTGTASTASFATTAFSLNGFVPLTGSVGFATTATNIGSGNTGSLPYQSSPGITTFLSAPEINNQVLLYSDGTNQPVWSKVGLGTNTTGEYVKTISGSTNEIEVSSGTGEGSTPIVGFVDSPIIQGSLQVNTNLNVTGNITVGGTTAVLNATKLQIKDKDIILGITTNALDQDVSTDITANHGGIAIASTEGSPLIDINGGVGTDTIPNTYKQIMWLKSGSWTGLGTDAWLFNYGVGIGSTQFPLGTRLAVGSIQFTENDIATVRNINSTGISTFGNSTTGIKIDGNAGIITSNTGVAVTFFGNLTGTASTASFATTAFSLNGFVPLTGSVGFATTATNIGSGNTGSLPYQNSPGITTFLSAPATPNQVLIYDTGSNKPKWGPVTGTGAISGVSITDDPNTNASRFLLFTDQTSGTVGSQNVSSTKLVFNPLNGSLGIGTTSPSTPLQVDRYGVKTVFGTFVATAGITTDIDSFVIATNNFKTAEYTVHIQSSSSIQAQKVLVMQNGTSAFSQEYGIMYEPTFMVSIGATVSGGSCKLQFTPESGISGLMTYRFTRETMI